MLWDTLERVNRLRQASMSNPEFIQSAKEHEKTLQHVEKEFEPKQRRKLHASKTKCLAEIYRQSDFGHNPSGIQH